MTAVLNGQQRRPSLNDQIVRLDRILDGLSEGLNESVATAVQGAVRAAVREATETVLRELLTSGAALPTLAAAMAPPTPPAKPSLIRRMGNGLHRLWRSTINTITALPSTVVKTVKAIGNGLHRAAKATSQATIQRITRSGAIVVGLVMIAWRLRRSVPLAVTVGMAAAALGYTANPEIAAVLHGMTVATLAFMARMLPKPRPVKVAAAHV